MFSYSIDLAVINEYQKGAVMEISTVLCHVYHVVVKGFSETWLFRHLSGYDFAVRNFKITKSMRVSFLSKCSKFHRDFKIDARNAEKGFCFWDNCIWIGIVKLSLLRRGYISSAANVLTSSPKILHVNQRDVFQLNWLGTVQ